MAVLRWWPLRRVLLKRRLAKRVLLKGHLAKRVLLKRHLAKRVLRRGYLAKRVLLKCHLAKRVLFRGYLAKRVVLQGHLAKRAASFPLYVITPVFFFIKVALASRPAGGPTAGMPPNKAQETEDWGEVCVLW